jgi:methionine synthase I (cobalamin-dependent)/5,10-methylenetetrahydrofolate reductase
VKLVEALERDSILVCDGAMGTLLHAAGNSLDQALPALNMSAPERVRAIHDSYIDAGVDMIQTNTFGASRLRLAEYGYGSQVEEINRAGIHIARQAAGKDSGVLVAGSVSPAVTVKQRRQAERSERADALREQIAALSGADLIILETFGYLDELEEAIEVAAQVSQLPVVVQATFAADGCTLSGHTPREVAEAVRDAPIAALGINCTLGPQRSLDIARALRAHSEIPLSVQPNAGLPRRVAPARFEYDADAEYFARYVRQLLESGAAIVGGCCGTTPAQLAAAVEVANSHRRQHRLRSAALTVAAARAPQTPARQPAPLMLSNASPRIVGTELVTPVNGDVDRTLELAGALTAAGAQFVAITPARTQHAQVSAVDFAVHLNRSAAIETVASVTTWDRTIMALQADLLGAHALGLRRIICETGSPPLLGDYPHVDGIWDVDSTGLIQLVASLNSGTDYYGLPFGAKTEFEIGARINPGSRDPEREVSRTLGKVSAGATFLVTRPVYELTALERLLEAVGGQVPVLVSVAPLNSFEEAEYLAHEVPDVIIPPYTLTALERAGQTAPQVGIELAVTLAAQLKNMANGIVISAGAGGVGAVQQIMAA